MQQGEALWVKVFKGLYFPNCSFLEARKGTRASWCWNILLERIDIIKENGIWKVRNGEDIDIWGDIWIPGLEKGVLEVECI